MRVADWVWWAASVGVWVLAGLGLVAVAFLIRLLMRMFLGADYTR